MRVILFSSQTYDRDSFLGEPLPSALELQFLQTDSAVGGLH